MSNDGEKKSDGAKEKRLWEKGKKPKTFEERELKRQQEILDLKKLIRKKNSQGVKERRKLRNGYLISLGLIVEDFIKRSMRKNQPNNEKFIQGLINDAEREKSVPERNIILARDGIAIIKSEFERKVDEQQKISSPQVAGQSDMKVKQQGRVNFNNQQAVNQQQLKAQVNFSQSKPQENHQQNQRVAVSHSGNQPHQQTPSHVLKSPLNQDVKIKSETPPVGQNSSSKSGEKVNINISPTSNGRNQAFVYEEDNPFGGKS